MRSLRPFTHALGVIFGIVLAASASAQPGSPSGGGRPVPAMREGMGRGAGGPVGATADFLLAHTGDLGLTDAQVVRLAAISRRTQARRAAMAARLDSARAAARSAPGDTMPGRGRGPAPPPPAEVRQMRDQMHADVRDAIAVLTADQQATAWMMVAGGGPLGGGAGGPMGPGGGPGRANDSGGAPDRGAISRPPAPRDVPRRPDDATRSTTP